MLRNLLKITIRNFKRQLGFSLLNILGLTIGMASFILITLWIMDELNYDKNHVNSNRIYSVYKSYFVSGSQTYNTSTPAPLAPKIKTDFPEIEAATRLSKFNVLLRYDDKIFYDELNMVDPDFLHMFSFDLLKGNPNSALLEPNSVIISEHIAEKYFGDKNPIGEVLVVENRLDFKVTGVFKNPPDNTSVDYHIISHLDDSRFIGNWQDHPYETFIMLAEGSDHNALDLKMSKLFQHKLENDKIGIKTLPLSDVHLYTIDGKNEPIQYVKLFLVIAVFILIIACINFMNLSTARASQRSKEIGLRKVVGAERGQLVWQFLLESVFFSFLALILAMVVSELLMPLFNQLTDKNLVINYSNPMFFLGLIGLIIFIGLLAGSYPAFFLSSFRPIIAIKGTFKIGTKGLLFRKFLVIFQFSISVILIISTFIIYSQINYIQNKDLGFDEENLVYFRSEEGISNRFDAFKSELLQNPNILNISRTSQIPSQMTDIKRGVTWEGIEDPSGSVFAQCAVDYDYFKTMKMEMAEGRVFSKEFGMDTRNYIINQKAADLIGWENPVGRDFGSPGGNSKIIGVVKDFNALPAAHEIQPLFFFHNTNWFWNILIRIRPDNQKETISHIEQIFTAYVPETPFRSNFLDRTISQQYKSEQTIGKLSSVFSLIAIIISCLGLFGLAAFSAEQKTKEIGVRKIFGASIGQIIYRLTVSFTIWVLLANLIAWPIAYLTMENWLNNFAFRVNIYWWIFALAALISVLIALITVGFQTLRTARKNPIEALRYE